VKPAILDRLRLEAVPPNKWKVIDHYAYRTLVTGQPETINVPYGFINDLASIPRILRILIPVNGRHRGAAVIHDWLYKQRGLIPGMRLTRKQCDQIFLEAMAVAEVSRWKRYSMYRGVRAFGWAFWRKQQ